MFLDGAKKCAPMALQEECNACGSAGCSFFGSDCHLECKTTGSGGSGGSTTMPDGGKPDASVPDAAVPDASTPDASTPDGSTSSSGKPCCATCAGPTDTSCSAGNSCHQSSSGGYHCSPTECGGCDYGCTFTCPL